VGADREHASAGPAAVFEPVRVSIDLPQAAPMNGDDPTKPDLSLVATDWLVEELQTRHDAVLIVRETAAPQGETETIIQHSGGVSRNIGLAVRAQRRLLALVHHADTSE
jgi:hypothetical protein